MEYSFSEQLRIILRRNGLSVADLAEMMGTSRQNLNQRLNRDTWTFKDMEYICDIIGYDIKIVLTKREE